MNRNEIIAGSIIGTGMAIIAAAKTYKILKTEEAKREQIRRNTIDEVVAIRVGGARTQQAVRNGEVHSIDEAMRRLEFETIIAYNEFE